MAQKRLGYTDRYTGLNGKVDVHIQSDSHYNLLELKYFITKVKVSLDDILFFWNKFDKTFKFQIRIWLKWGKDRTFKNKYLMIVPF